MLLLLSNSKPLTLANVSFNLTLASPINGENAGSYVFSVSVPYEGNAAKFGFPYRLTRLSTVKATTQGEILYNGVHVQSGIWQAKSSNGLTIDLEMVIGGSHFNSLVDGHTLEEYFDIEVGFGEYLIPHINAVVNNTYPATKYNFPSILNTKLYGDDETNPHWGGVINDYEDGFIDEGRANAVSPQFYLLYVIKHLFEANNYTPTGNFFTDELLQKALLYNNYMCDRLLQVSMYAGYFMQAVYSPYTVLWNAGIIDPLEEYDETTGEYSIESAGIWQIDVNINARINTSASDIEYFFIKILVDGSNVYQTAVDVPAPDSYQDYSASYQYTASESDVGKPIKILAYYYDVGNAQHAPFIQRGNFNIVKSSEPVRNIHTNFINYKNHIPKLDVKDFLEAVYNSLQVIPFFDHRARTVELVFLRDSFKASNKATYPDGLIRDTLKVYQNNYDGLTFNFDFQGPDDLLSGNFTEPETVHAIVDTYSDLPEYTGVEQIFFVTKLNAYYKHTYIEPPEPAEGEDPTPGYFEWQAYGDKHDAVVHDNGSEEKSIALAPMLMRNVVRKSTNRSMPAIEGQGTSLVYKIEGEFPLRIMFYTGLSNAISSVDGSNAAEYPFATTMRYNSAGTDVLGFDYKMENIISRYWTPVIAWYKRRQKIEFTNLVTPEFISNVKLKNQFLFQNTLIFIEEIVVKIKNKLFGPGDFEGWTN